MPIQPDITSPVSRGKNASIGITMNYGTSKGVTGLPGIGGIVNNSKGGFVDNGNLSFNQAPKNASFVQRDPSNGGASKTVSVSSQNPLSIQDDSTNEVDSQYVAKSTSGAVNAAGAGNFATLPRSDKVVDMPVVLGSVRVNSAELEGDVYQRDPHFGENLSAGSTDNLQRMAQDFTETEENSNKKQDGAKSVGSPAPQPRTNAVYGVNSNSSEFPTDMAGLPGAIKASPAKYYSGLQQ